RAPAIEHRALPQPLARQAIETFDDMPVVPCPVLDNRRVTSSVREIAQRPKPHEPLFRDARPAYTEARHERNHPLEQSLAFQKCRQPQRRREGATDGDRYAEWGLLALTPI